MTELLEIDGSLGEGGGQVLRTALGLSLCTGRPFRIRNIRAGRKRPGLLRQHLTGVRAATALGRAEVEGDVLGSKDLVFRPGQPNPGRHELAIGSAGSTTLVLQAILPALLLAPGPSEIVLSGGTHNPAAPPFDFLDQVLLPLVNQMGPRVEAILERPGFFPAGGGRLRVRVEPAERLKPLWLETRGEIRRVFGTARVAALPSHIGRRELRQLRKALHLDRGDLICEELDARFGPGNVVCVEAIADEATELFSGFGQKGVRAEKVAQRVADRTRRWIEADVPVGEHLADQLIPLIALAGRGGFRTLPLSGHATTQIELVRRFLEVNIVAEREDDTRWRVEIGSPAS